MNTIVGLTGAIGSGKSTLAKFLVAWRFKVLDVDELAATAAKEAGYEPRAALEKVLAGDKALEAQLAAVVIARVKAWVAATRGLKLIDAALLFEHGLDSLCTVTVCLTCPREVRQARVTRRKTASAGLFEVIERTQWAEAGKASKANHVVDANRELDVVAADVVRVLGVPAP
ncbi:MAG: dephospho-CoA kinase [Myxococcaceae bacterium]